MHMRLVQASTKPGEVTRLRWMYEDRVVPALQKTPGCLYACLMQNSREPDEVISMTLWESEAKANAYEQSGLFRKLFEEAKPMFLSESLEWRVQLSKDLRLEYVPTPVEPVVKAYAIPVMSRTLNSNTERPSDMFLRIVSVKLKSNKRDEFRELYIHEIIPTLQSTNGCRNAYLLMHSDIKSSEALSVTIWDSKEAADEYELSGTFANLVDNVKHTFTDIFQWKMKLEHAAQESFLSRDHHFDRLVNEIAVDRYSLLTGKVFK